MIKKIILIYSHIMYIAKFILKKLFSYIIIFKHKLKKIMITKMKSNEIK